MLICRIVHRSPDAPVSYTSTYRDDRSRGRGGNRCVRRCRGIAIEHDVGDFKGKLVTHLELEAMPSVGRSLLLLHLSLLLRLRLRLLAR